MQQAAPKFEPRHAAHAIEQFAVTLSFAGAINDEVLRRVIAASDQFDADLPGKGPHESTVSFAISPAGDVQVGAVPRPGRLPGWLRQRLRPDGAIEAQLRMARSELTYITGSYTRWNNIFPKVKQYFGNVLPIYSGAIALRGISLQYLDKFIWKGPPADVRAAHIIRPKCKYVGEFVFGLSDHWHCHIGSFTRPSADTKRLLNINIDTGDESTIPGQTDKVVNIMSVLTDNFNQAGYDKLEVAAANCMNVFETHAEALHTESKAILADILTDELVARIQLDAP